MLTGLGSIIGSGWLFGAGANDPYPHANLNRFDLIGDDFKRPWRCHAPSD